MPGEEQHSHEYQFDAFISYSHANAPLAERISKRIRQYQAPRKANLAIRKLTVFRDVERLTSGSRLSDELKKNVMASRKLVLLASPDSAGSGYVDEEIGLFLEHNSIDSVIIVLVDGELAQSTPPAISGKVKEPLYVDLRETSTKAFRAESLRIIASLFDVDYAELQREDDALRRRQRSTWIAASMLAMLLVASLFLIFSVGPETWTKIPQPTYVSNLMPVHDIVVSAEDPSVILYRGFDANWASNPVPEGYYFRDVQSGDFEVHSSSDFGDQVRRHFLSKTSAQVEEVARIEFLILGGYDGESGTGLIQIYPIFQPGAIELDYFRTLVYQGTTEDGVDRRLLLQSTLLHNSEGVSEGPFDLYPWPTDTLAKLGLYNFDSNINMKLTNRLNGQVIQRELEPWDADEGFWEWAEIWGPATTIFSNRDSDVLMVGEDALSDIENEDELWQEEILEDTRWKHFTYPQIIELGSIYEEDEGEISNIISKLTNRRDEQSFELLFRECLKGRINNVQLIQDTTGIEVSVLEFTGFMESSEREEETIPQWLFRSSENTPWVKVDLPLDSNPKLRILNVTALNEEGSHAAVLTNTEGLFRTTDSGQTMQDINFGESGFIQGDRLKVIVTQSPSSFYVLIDRNETFSEGENPLFRLKKRNLIDRWRAGLIALLQE